MNQNDYDVLAHDFRRVGSLLASSPEEAIAKAKALGVVAPIVYNEWVEFRARRNSNESF